MKYYLLSDDINFSKRWYLGDVRHIENWLFVEPPLEFMEPCTYTIDVFQDGNQMDYTEANGSVPILSHAVKKALEGIPEIDEPYSNVVIEPMVIGNKEVDNDYFVMIVETQLDCVDEHKSIFQKYEVNDPVRPDKAGDYRSFISLVIDPKKAEGKHIFRLKKRLGAIVVSEYVKDRFENAGISGAKFESVNGDCQTVA